jgi:hypothetical protein
MTIKETWAWWWHKPSNDQTVWPPVGEIVGYAVRMIFTAVVVLGLIAWLVL